MKKVKWGVLGTADIARGQTIPGMQLAKNCELYRLLTTILPLDKYEGTQLCPYNMATWGN